MAEGGGEDDERLLKRTGEGGARGIMNQLRESEGTGEGGRGSIAIGNVFCFGSIPAVLDVAGGNVAGRGGEGIEIGREREDVENREEREPQRQGSGGGARNEDEQVESEGGNGASERSLEEGYHANGANGKGGVEGKDVASEVVERGEKDKRVGRKEVAGRNESVDETMSTEAVSQNASPTSIDRSLSPVNDSATNVEPVTCEELLPMERDSEHSNSVQEVNGSPSGEAQFEALVNEREHLGSAEINTDSIGSEVGEVDCDHCESSAEDESRDAVLQAKKIPQPLPPVLASADERSITLSWVGCQMAVSYYLDYACIGVSTAPNGAPNSVFSGGGPDCKWSSVSCGEGRSCKVENLKPGTPYSFRLRVVCIVALPSTALPSPTPSDIAEYSTLPAAPSPPSCPSLAIRARTHLKVKWVAPSETGGLPLEYVVEMNPPPGKGDANEVSPITLDGFVRVYTGKETAVKVTQLLPGTEYRFRVLAANSIGKSQFSEESSHMTDASVPSAPEAPRLVSATATSMTVEWQEPNNSGSPVTDYTLEHDDGASGPFSTVYNGERRHYTMEGLKSGHLYRVRVMAHNRKGKGLFSKPAELYTNFATPSPPAPPTITGCSTTSIAIVWGSPECDGGSPITAFEVDMKKFMSGWTGLVHYGNANTYTVTGLSPGEQIGVRVRAVNLMGKSGWSGEARFSTLPGPPEAPSVPVALDVGSCSIMVGWCAPVHDGGSQIDFYHLKTIAWKELTPRSGRVQEENRKIINVYRVDNCKFKVGGLEPGTTYMFQVQAINEYGAGPYSASRPMKTLSAPPAAPEPPVVVGKSSASSVSLRWSPPRSNGASIESYLLQMRVLGYGEKCLSGCDDSTSGSGYDLQRGDFASLASQRGHSDSSSPFSELPHSPSHSTSSDSSRGTSTWESEKSSQKNRKSPSYAGTSEDEHDVHGVLYKRGVDGPVTSSRPYDLGLVVNSGHRNMTLSDAYVGPNTAHTVSKLQPHTSYAFRVQAQNGAGSSTFSDFSICMTSPAAPCAPCPPIVEETTSSSLTLRWEVPEQDNGLPVVRFTLEMLKLESNSESMLKERNILVPNGHRKSGKKKSILRDVLTQMSVWDPIYDGKDIRYEVADLLPGQKYTFRVIAHNELGTSPPSLFVESSTLPSAPGAPPPPTFSKVTPKGVHIKWSSPARDNGMPVTSYVLVMDDGQGGRLSKVYAGGGTSYKALKLQPDSSYRVAVQAINSRGASDVSEIAVIKLPAAPPVPAAPKIDLSIEERQAPTVVLNKPKPSFQKEFTELVNSVRQVSRKVQQPWSLQTRRWISGVGVSVTLIAAILTVM